jgi:hypothetical protein
MKKLKAFFYIFKQSLTSTDYYKKMLKTEPAFTVKYMAVLFLIMATLTSVATFVRVLPKSQSFLDTQIHKLADLYPQDLEITMVGGEWSINQAEPYVLTLPFMEFGNDMLEDRDVRENMNERKNEEKESFPENLIVFDHEGTLEDFEAWDTVALINEKNALVQGEFSTEVMPLRYIPDGKFTHKDFEMFIDNLGEFSKVLPYFLFFVITFLVFFEYFVLRSVYLFVLGGILYLVARLFGTKSSYKDALRIGAHTVTLPLVVRGILSIIWVAFPIPMWFFFLNLGFGAVVLARMNKGK